MQQKSIAERILKFLASLKLAVIIIIALGILSAWGTILESKYGVPWVAQKVVYHSPYMIITMLALTVNLIAVIVDRYPWKKHHLGFILAHIGIIVLLIGSVMTKKLGIDGSLQIKIGEAEELLQLPETDVIVWASYNGSSFTKLFEKEVDFYIDPPSDKKPFKVSLPDSELEIVDYMPFAFRESKIIGSENPTDGPAIRFQLENANVNVSEWLQMEGLMDAPSILNLGPAKVVLNRGNYKPTGDNEIVLTPSKEGEGLNYKIHSQREGVAVKSGTVDAGETIETGWMGLKFRVLKYLPHSQIDTKFVPNSRHVDGQTAAAVKVRFNGQENWASVNSTTKFFSNKAAYFMAYANRRTSIGFPLKLLEFRMDTYQGTKNPATYESDVDVPGLGKVNISMNEPMKHKGLTFYQSSFNQDETTGEPTHSVFSVNKDPGRWMKYLGSALIVLGTIVMFYFRKILIRKISKKVAA